MEPRISKLFSLLLIATITLCFPAQAQKINEFSVKQCVDFGMQNSAQVRNALLDIKIQEQTNRDVTSNALPHLTGSADLTRYFDIPVQSLPNFISPATYGVLIQEGVKNGSGNTITMPNGGDFGTIAAQFGVPWTSSAGLQLSQVLFDGQVFVGLQARRSSIRYANCVADVTREQIKANIYKIYYQLVIGRKQLESIDANIGRCNKLLSDSREMYKNGFAEKLDVDKATVALMNLQTEKEKLENQLAIGNAGLKFLINMPQKESLVLTDTIGDNELKSGILDSAYNYNDRKDIRLLSEVEKLNEYNIKRYQLSKLPSVAAFASYSKNAQRTTFDIFEKGDWFTTSVVGIKISVPLFTGFSTNAKIQTARLTLQKTRNSLAAAKEQVDNEIFSARKMMTTAVLTVDYQKKNIELAETVYNSAKKKYEQGLGSNTEIYAAQTELKVAQTNYYSALYDAIIAKIDYLLASGKL